MSPFDDLSKNQIKKLFDLLEVHIYNFSKNEDILSFVRNDNIVGIILSGYAQIINTNYSGNETIIEKLYKDSVFSTNLSLTNNENYHINAKEDTVVLIIDYDKLLNINNLKFSFFNIFFRNLFSIYNIKIKDINERVRILEQKQIRNKLLEFFEIQHKKTRLKYINLPFSLKDLADYIGVNRTAMFREIKHMKNEKFIEISNHKITLLYKMQ